MSRPGTFTSQATVLILLEALTIAVAAGDREQSLDHTERMNQLREDLNGYSLRGRRTTDPAQGEAHHATPDIVSGQTVPSVRS